MDSFFSGGITKMLTFFVTFVFFRDYTAQKVNYEKESKKQIDRFGKQA
jgi:hypothetical protein